MRTLRRFLQRLTSWATTQQDEERLQAEIEKYLALLPAEDPRAGLSPVEAGRQAALTFGAVEAMKESYRDQRGLQFMETLIQNARQALRRSAYGNFVKSIQHFRATTRYLSAIGALTLCLSLFPLVFAQSATAEPSKFPILQAPSLSLAQIVFVYAGDLWIVDRNGGRASRLTTAIGFESSPIFSPDGATIAFTGEYDGNTDVYTIPSAGGIPRRITYHPAGSSAVGWTPDGKQILFRSGRQSISGASPKLYTVDSQGGFATPVPLPTAYEGNFSPDGSHIAYVPLAPVADFSFTSYHAWQNYRGGRAGTIWIASLPGLDTAQIPHERASDFSPVYVGQRIYFLSARNGRVGIFSYDLTTKTVSEVFHNTGPDLRSLSGGPDGTLVYDQLGQISVLDPGTRQPRLVSIDVAGDFPDVRPRTKNVGSEVQHTALSPTGDHVALEAHGEILTISTEKGLKRNLTKTPGIAERDPAWSPDGQSVAYFSDESGLYALHIVSPTGNGQVKKVPLSPEPTYYYKPLWSPDSKRITFYDNRLTRWILDVSTGKVTFVDKKDIFGPFSSSARDAAWSPDSRWLVYTCTVTNHLNVLYLYSVDSGQSTQITSQMADSRSPVFDRSGKYLYFTASTNSGPTSYRDMSTFLYPVTNNIYVVVLANNLLSPFAPENQDGDTRSVANQVDEARKGRTHVQPNPLRIDLPGIESRIVALPLPARAYSSLSAGKPGSLYFLEAQAKYADFYFRAFPGTDAGTTLTRFILEKRKSEKLADHARNFELSFDGEKMLLEMEGEEASKKYRVLAAGSPVNSGVGGLSLADLEVRIDPLAEWSQMYHEVWRLERSFFYATNFHGVDTGAAERRFEPYVRSLVSRADLNYIFHEMLGAFSVSHMSGGDGDIPAPKRISGGLLGADYVMKGNRYCIAKIYSGGEWNPELNAPLAQPGLNVNTGDCILAINGQEATASTDIQALLEGTADRTVTLRITSSVRPNPREVNVVPISSVSEWMLRRNDWIETNRLKVDILSGGKLAYVYIPDTSNGGFTSFNRHYFAQVDKQGVIIDERYNAGGLVADYFLEVMRRQLMAYRAPRYGAMEHTPTAIFGPRVMIMNEVSQSGGDNLPWFFRNQRLGPLVGKRTWGGSVGMSGGWPKLMDGGWVTAPNGPFLSVQGKWELENEGTEPDVVVEQDPELVSEGHDPQLEKAVELALKELTAHPPSPTQITRPPYPNFYK